METYKMMNVHKTHAYQTRGNLLLVVMTLSGVAILSVAEHTPLREMTQTTTST